MMIVGWLLVVLAVGVVALEPGQDDNLTPKMVATFPSTDNIPDYATTSCKAANGVLYIDTNFPFTRPSPPTTPYCVPGYTFAILTAQPLYYTALQVAARCAGEGASFWARYVGNPPTGPAFGYYMLLGLLNTFTGAKNYPQTTMIPAATGTTEVIVATEGPVPLKAGQISPDMETLYPPIPYVCLNVAWTLSYS